MTLQAVAGFLGQSGLQHPAKLYRNFSAAHSGRRSGAFRYNDFTLTPSGAAMSLNIGQGDAYLHGTEAVTDQGGYFAWNNTTETLAWPAAVSLPRVDSLILRVIDTDYGSDPAGSKATWEVVSGTAAASPTAVADSAFAPAGAFYHPGAWLRVADFTLGASITNLAAATVSHKRKYTRIGRHALVLGADLPSDAQLGDIVQLIDGNGERKIYYNSAWNTVSQIVTGTYTPALTSSGTAPTMGTGATAEGRFTIFNGKWCTVRGTIQFGTASAAAGTGQYFVSLPFNTSASITAGVANVGSCYLRDSSVPAIAQGISYAAASVSTLSLVVNNTTVTAAAPWAWNNSDYISWTMTYEIA